MASIWEFLSKKYFKKTLILASIPGKKGTSVETCNIDVTKVHSFFQIFFTFWNLKSRCVSNNFWTNIVKSGHSGALASAAVTTYLLRGHAFQNTGYTKNTGTIKREHMLLLPRYTITPHLST